MPPREGAFAQVVAMPVRNLVTVPESLTLEQAALAEPVACGWHAVRLGRAVLGDGAARALVIGGGPIGVGAALSVCWRSGHRRCDAGRTQRACAVTTCRASALCRRDRRRIWGNAAFELWSIDGVGYDVTRALASARVRPGGVIAAYRAGRRCGRVRLADHAAGNHRDRHLYLQRAGLPRHRRRHVRWPTGRAGLARTAAPCLRARAPSTIFAPVAWPRRRSF